MDLEASWAVTRRHLDAAARMLPEERLAEYRSWLEHNELELALDELAAIGDALHPPRGFWEELARAAANMRLDEKAARLRGPH